MPATPRDLERLKGVHPQLVAIVIQFINELPLFVVMGVRTTAEQAALYAQGRTLPGHIVTYKDGVIHRSNHQPHPDGMGYAVDLAFLGGDPFNLHHPWEEFGLKAEAAGLTWGGRWKMRDLPHIELPIT